ncbi:MAG: hypothetical protein H8D74_00895 [Chloroflexi bacterium]|nr:hypothetical protein [Chloroflexota bacterium]
MSDLKNYNDGDGFTTIEANVTLLSKRTTKSMGDVQDALLVGDDGGTLGIAFWLKDGPAPGDGQRVKITDGWIEMGKYDPFKDKLTVRMKKDGKFTVMGAAPAPQPAAAPTPKPPPPQPVQYTDKGPQLFIQWSVRTAAHVLGMKSELPPDMEEIRKYALNLRKLVREETTGKPHWIADEETRKKFWAWMGEQGLNSKDAHEALAAGSVYDFPGSKADAIKRVQAYIGGKE